MAVVAFPELAMKVDSCHSQVVGIFLKHVLNLHYVPGSFPLHATNSGVREHIIISIVQMRKRIF